MVRQGDTTFQDQAAVLPVSYMSHFDRDMTLAAGSQAITGVGFIPSSIIFFSVKHASYEASWGFSNDTADKCVFDNNGNTTDTRATGTAQSIWCETDGSNWTGATISSLDSDGFTLTWTKGGSPTGNFRVHFMAFK